KGVLITGSKLKAFRNPQPSWGFSVHNKNTGVMPVFFTEEVSNAFNCDEHNGDLAEWLWQHH
uniref:hypothetical protein n=1 Tax=Escherichia coli TaxID=562 RepID=UPI0019652BFA